jgi:hypothetical protein
LFMKVSAAFVGRFEMYPPFVGRKTCRSTTCHSRNVHRRAHKDHKLYRMHRLSAT